MYTKEKWEVLDEKKPDGWLIITPGKQICTVFGSDGDVTDSVFVSEAVCEANARRIVTCISSHDALLEALKKANWLIENSTSMLTEEEEIQEQIDAAIASAERRE